jgi:hypothetical protein
MMSVTAVRSMAGELGIVVPAPPAESKPPMARAAANAELRRGDWAARQQHQQHVEIIPDLADCLTRIASVAAPAPATPTVPCASPTSRGSTP